MLRTHALARTTALTVALLASLAAPSSAEPLALQPVGASFPGRIAATAPTADGWVAVGARGLLALRRGIAVEDTTPWVVERTDTTADLNAVWAAPQGDVFAAGDRGIVLHRAPEGRVDVAVVDPDHHRLLAVSGRSGRDVWVVGDGGFAAHFDGATWSRVATAVDRSLWAVDASAAGVYAGGMGIVLDLGRAGRPRPLPGLGEGRMVRALAARSPRDIVALGDGLLSFDGRVWTERADLNLGGGPPLLVRDGRRVLLSNHAGGALVDGPTVTNLPSAGLALAGLRFDRGVVRALAADGANLVLEPGAVTMPLRMLGSAVRSGGFRLPFDAFGPETAAGTVTLSGPGWTAELASGIVRAHAASPSAAAPEPPADLPFAPLGTFRRGDEVLALGSVPQGVAVFRSSGGGWQTVADPWTVARWPGVPTAIGGTSRPGEPFWIAGPGFFVRAEPSSHAAQPFTFRRMRLGRGAGSVPFRAIAELGRALFARGDGSDVFRFDGRYWRAEPGAPGGVVAMAERGPGRVLALGTGLTVRREGAYFAPIDSDATLSSALAGLEHGPPSAVWAASPRDVWLAHDNRLWRFDGARWRAERTYVDDAIASLSGAGGALWVTTRTGEILVRTARGLRPLPADPRVPVSAVRVLSSNDAFVGSAGTILRWDGRRFVRELGTAADSSVPAWAEPRPPVTAFARIEGRLHAFVYGARAPLVRRDGRWTPAPESDPAARFPADPDGRDAPTAICAALEPANAPPMLVSCEARLVLTLGPTGWQPETLPGDGSLRGATCLPEEGCFLFGSEGTWRVAAR